MKHLTIDVSEQVPKPGLRAAGRQQPQVRLGDGRRDLGDPIRRDHEANVVPHPVIGANADDESQSGLAGSLSVRPKQGVVRQAGNRRALAAVESDAELGRQRREIRVRRDVPVESIDERSGVEDSTGVHLDCEPGDIVAVPSGTRHIHGARPGASAVHVAITGGETIWDVDPRYPES